MQKAGFLMKWLKSMGTRVPHLLISDKIKTNEPQREKTNNVDCDQVWHKPGCTATGDGLRLEILDLGSRGIVLSK